MRIVSYIAMLDINDNRPYLLIINITFVSSVVTRITRTTRTDVADAE
jgi:hypothetical protein